MTRDCAWFPPHARLVADAAHYVGPHPPGVADAVMGTTPGRSDFRGARRSGCSICRGIVRSDRSRTISLAPAAPYNPLRRNANGTISWMATMVPRLDRVGNPTDSYTLSIVVFSRRVLDPDPSDPSSERVVMVARFYSGLRRWEAGTCDWSARPEQQR